MSPLVFFAVLGAALLHATWNALIKGGGNKFNGMFLLTFVQGLIGLAVALTLPLPGGQVWLWLLASGVTHTAYKFFLSFAYDQGDLSRVYPIARGAAPMIVAMVGVFALSDRISGLEYLGILAVGVGILLMAHGVFSNGESKRLLPFALGSAAATASYSLIDGIGARISGDAVVFVAWLFVFDMLFFTALALAMKGRGLFRASRGAWLNGSLAAAASYGAYAIAVWAMTQAPIALVTALRETSILFAVLIGWLFFKEKMERGKAVAAGLIVLGVVLTRI